MGKLKGALARLKATVKTSKKKASSSHQQPTAPKNVSKDSKAPKKIMPYTLEDEILLVGEGNFSFANALALLLQSGENITATCYDSEEILNQKYDDAKAHIESLLSLQGTVMHGVDATQLSKHKRLKLKRFSKIIFNFPHTGSGIKDQEINIRTNQKLLNDFFVTAKEHVSIPKTKFEQPGEIHVTIKDGEPYASWNIRKIANQCGLQCQTSFKFHPELYDSYRHRRTLGYQQGLSDDDNNEVSSARTYVFVIAREPENPKKRKKGGDDSDSD
ncbi:hypothetical protein SmJEL517_g01691 [Synchytrium microbalum]|uniref:25S rRNA (uridine-N(3))-methyltransferase BMT5-like domain-containing protein n=1 Tax=Synchytrium microbalum TaxID=1806994 RepID=A0A507C2Y0_9FUNG|nr:uncharacterized protein SmJEL517_g01691 [Synchytrium microbalum]TPX35870.1 hypothetical protein SmJEL517_g01691 [Synchytrium microbalum]